MPSTVFHRIQEKQASFSQVQEKIANYIRANYIQMTYLSISEISREIGVSTGSITSFCKYLDYTGFQSLHQELRRIAQEEVFPLREIKNSITSKSLGQESDVLQQVLNLNIDNLQSTYTDHLVRNFTVALELLGSARHIYILGLRSCYSVAYYFYFMLRDIGVRNVTLLTLGAGDVFDCVSNISEDDLILSISFKPYTQATCHVTQFFHTRGASIIALTDLQSATIADNAKSVLIAKNSSTTFSFVSALTILNALVIALGRRNQDETMQSLSDMQALLHEQNIHYP